MRSRSPLYLPYISLYLPHISQGRPRMRSRSPLYLPRISPVSPLYLAGSTADEITISLAHEQAALATPDQDGQAGGVTSGQGGEGFQGGGVTRPAPATPPPSDSTAEPPLRKQRRAARPRLPRALQGSGVCVRKGEVPSGGSDARFVQSRLPRTFGLPRLELAAEDGEPIINPNPNPNHNPNLRHRVALGLGCRGRRAHTRHRLALALGVRTYPHPYPYPYPYPGEPIHAKPGLRVGVVFCGRQCPG